MAPTHFLIAMLGGIVLSWGVHSVLPHSPPPMSAPDDPQTEQVDNEPAPENDTRDLKQALARLTSRVMSLEHRLQTLPQANSAATAPEPSLAEAVETAAPVLDETVLAEQSQLRWDNYLGALETSFHDERTDAVWSATTLAEIEEIFASETLTGSAIFGLECRATLCRIDALHDDTQAVHEFTGWLPQRLADKLPQAIFDYYEQDDGTTVTTVFLAREGYDLPAPSATD